jgi:hypothetical protein
MLTYHGIHLPEVTRDQVLEGLDHFFFRRYYTRRDKPEVAGDTWLLGVADDLDGWCSVYDSGENFRRANQLAKALSAYLHRPALWMGLFEDLDFYYQLFHEGDAIDAYDSDPSIFDPDEGFTDAPEGPGWLPADFSGVNKDRNLAALGNPAAFFSVVRPAVNDADLRLQALLSRGRAYHSEGLPESEELSWADEGVPKMAELLGLNADRARTGFDLLTTDEAKPAWLHLYEYHKLAKGPEKPKRRRKEVEE